MNLKRLTAAGALVLLATAACSMTTEAITQKPYAPSDGIRVHLDSDVVFENLMIISDGNGEGVLYGLVNNRSEEAVTAEISGGDITESFDVEASSHLNFSTAELAENDELILIEGDFQPGYNVDTIVTAGGAEAPAAIPVITACASGYEDAFPDAQCD